MMILNVGKRHLPIALSFVFAFFSSISIYQYLHARESSAAPLRFEPVLPVVIAKQDLTVGMKLTRDYMTTQNWPKGVAGPQYFQNAGPLIGRTLRSNCIAGEPITAAKLLAEGENFSALIPPHMRGVPVLIRKSGTLAKILEKDSRVDVVAILGSGELMTDTKVIAQGVRVLAIDSQQGKGGAENDSKNMEVLLLVSPRDADWIAYAQNHGVLELVVRNEKTQPQIRIEMNEPLLNDEEEI